MLAAAGAGNAAESDFASALRGAALLAALVLIVPPVLALAASQRFPANWSPIGRYMATWLGEIGNALRRRRDEHSPVAVSQDLEQRRPQFPRQRQGRGVQRTAGHAAAADAGASARRWCIRIPRSVLVVGCGAGVTAGSFTVHPGIKKIAICEIEPLVPESPPNISAEENYGVVNDPRTQIVFDDARHYILTTHEKFDIITSDPIHPWVKGSATLYTKEYFELVEEPFESRRHRHAMGAALRKRSQRREKRDRDLF